MNYKIKLAKPNRDKKRRPTRGQDWCHSCDAAQVRDGQKCPNCKAINGIRKNKKPYPKEDLLG